MIAVRLDGEEIEALEKLQRIAGVDNNSDAIRLAIRVAPSGLAAHLLADVAKLRESLRSLEGELKRVEDLRQWAGPDWRPGDFTPETLAKLVLPLAASGPGRHGTSKPGFVLTPHVVEILPDRFFQMRVGDEQPLMSRVRERDANGPVVTNDVMWTISPTTLGRISGRDGREYLAALGVGAGTLHASWGPFETERIPFRVMAAGGPKLDRFPDWGGAVTRQ